VRIFWTGLVLALGFLSLFGKPASVSLQNAWKLPSAAHPLGCSPLGEDVLWMLLVGTGSTIFISLTARLLSSFLSLFSLYAAWLGGPAGEGLLNRASEAMITIPSLLLAMAFAFSGASGSGSRIVSMVLAVAVSEWAMTTRWLSGRIREYSRGDYVTASVLMGAGRRHLFMYQFMPFLTKDLYLLFVLFLPSSVMTVAILEFLGFSSGIEKPGLGTMVALYQDSVFFRPLLSLAPAFVIVVLVWISSRLRKEYG